jgi:hypothetical protein
MKITFTPVRDAPNAPADHLHAATGVVMRRRYYRWTDRDLRFCWAVYVPGERDPRAEGDTLAEVRPAAVAAVEQLLAAAREAAAPPDRPGEPGWFTDPQFAPLVDPSL